MVRRARIGLTVVRTEAYIGLGSNEGDRLGMLARALASVDAEPGTRVLRVSRVYESEPWGPIDQPPFANAVALIAFDGEADALLAVMRRIEATLGRTDGVRNGPRPIDLDLLLFGEEEWDCPELTVPHPRMLERDFVVTPLLEIAPCVKLPDGRGVEKAGAVQGRIVGVLGEVPGFEDVTGVLEADDEAARLERADQSRPVQEGAVGEWVVVGPRRWERNAPNSGSGFDLLFYESVLQQAGIPCQFYPHRPNEGFLTPWGSVQPVSLMVPASRADEARALIGEIAGAPPETAG